MGKFIGWLIATFLGGVMLYSLCGATEDFERIYRWDTLTRAIFILGIIAWGIYVAREVSKD